MLPSSLAKGARAWFWGGYSCTSRISISRMSFADGFFSAHAFPEASFTAVAAQLQCPAVLAVAVAYAMARFCLVFSSTSCFPASPIAFAIGLFATGFAATFSAAAASPISLARLHYLNLKHAFYNDYKGLNMSSRSRLLHCDFTLHLNCFLKPYLPYLKYCTLLYARVAH